MAETRTKTIPKMKPTPPVFERRDDRGTFREIVNRGPWESVIAAEMRKGAVLGHHYHRETRIFLYMTRGTARVSTMAIGSGERKCMELLSGQGVYLEPLHAHAIRFYSDSEVIILKSRAYREADPDTYSYPVEEGTAGIEVHPADTESPGKEFRSSSRA